LNTEVMKDQGLKGRVFVSVWVFILGEP